MPDEGHSMDSQTDSEVKLFRRTFRSLYYRDFRIMWAGALTSTIGTWMQVVAQGWLVLELSNSPFILGLTAFLAELPFILFTLIGGAIADRIDRRKQLLVSQFVQMSTALTMAVLVYLDAVEIWHFFVMVFVVGSGQAFGAPAYMALLPGLVPRRHMPNAIALNSIQFNTARVIGPLLAGILMETVGPVYCFALNGLSFVAVICSLFIIKSTFKPKKSGRSVLRDIGLGLSYLREKGALWHLTILGFISSFCAVPLLTMLPVFARDVFQLDSTAYSYMMACSGVGAICGALLYANLSHMKGRGRVTLWTQLYFAVCLSGFALSHWLPLSLVLLFCGGIGMMMMISSINALVQLATAEEMRGRVLSIFTMSFRGGMPLGNLFTGALATRFSPQTALLVNGILLAITACSWLLSRSRVKQL